MSPRVKTKRSVLDQEHGLRRRRNMTMRYLGILLPLAITYGIGLQVTGSHQVALLRLVVGVGAVLWVGFACLLGLRRDWSGALAISVVYLILNGWMWLLALGVMDLG